MSEKIRNILIVCTAVCFLAGFFIGCLVKPQDEISLSERRQLAQFPQVGGKEIISGKFMKEFGYASDQFPLRRVSSGLWNGFHGDFTAIRYGWTVFDGGYGNSKGISIA